MNIAYANGIAGLPSIYNLCVSGSIQESVVLQHANGWLGDPHDSRIYKQTTAVPVTLYAGINMVRLQNPATTLNWITSR